MKPLRKFVKKLGIDEAQPLQIRSQGKFVAMIQWDGGGDMRHWVLVPIKKLKKVIKKMKRKAT